MEEADKTGTIWWG